MTESVSEAPERAAGASVLERLATFVAQAPLAPSPEVVAVVRDALVDVFGCILVGARQPVAERARAALAGSAPPAAPVYGTEVRTGPAQAALLNAVAGHALDLDDWELPGNTHPSVVLFPAILAASAGRRLSGAAAVEAYVVGFEAIARLGEAVNFAHYDRGWHTTATLGPIGAAAAVARVWELDRERTANALSLAISRAAGYTCQFGSDAKPLQAGFAAETGIVAARLAAHGLTAQAHVLDGPTGFNAVTAHGDADRFAAPFARLGAPLALAEHGLVFKAYPSCGYTHRTIECALALRRAGLGPDRVRRIGVSVPDFHAAILPFRHPRDRTEALFSLPFCAAVALVHGDVTLDDLDAETWRDPAIARLIERTEIRPFRPRHPDLNYDPEEPDRMTVDLDDGTVRRAAVAWPLGAPRNPMPAERLRAKLARNAGMGLGRERGTGLGTLERLMRWPDAPDVLALLADAGGIP